MSRKQKKQPLVYWIRVEVDPDCPHPREYVDAYGERIVNEIHSKRAQTMSNSTLLALIEQAIASPITKEARSLGKDKTDEADETDKTDETDDIDPGLLNDIDEGEEGEK